MACFVAKLDTPSLSRFRQDKRRSFLWLVRLNKNTTPSIEFWDDLFVFTLWLVWSFSLRNFLLRIC